MVSCIISSRNTPCWDTFRSAQVIHLFRIKNCLKVISQKNDKKSIGKGKSHIYMISSHTLCFFKMCYKFRQKVPKVFPLLIWIMKIGKNRLDQIFTSQLEQSTTQSSSGQMRLLRAMYNQIFNFSKHRYPTVSLGNLVQNTTILIRKKGKKANIFLISVPYSTLCLSTLTLSQCNSEKSLTPSSLCPLMR